MAEAGGPRTRQYHGEHHPPVQHLLVAAYWKVFRALPLHQAVAWHGPKDGGSNMVHGGRDDRRAAAYFIKSVSLGNFVSSPSLDSLSL